MIGSTLGHYRIIGKLGQGGMGTVYRAEHTLIGRSAAVKVLRPETSADPDMVRRFFNEARACSLIGHPGIVDVLDYGHHTNGQAYLVMELLEGESLAAKLRRERRLTSRLVHALGWQLAHTLAAAHAKGIIHRDLKPDNTFIVRDAAVSIGLRAKILDFGIAKLERDALGASAQTLSRSVFGTPAYMSPEQLRSSAKIDQRADIYSLGCMLFEMLCGRPPFVGEGLGDLVALHMVAPAPSPQSVDPSVPADLDRLVLRMLAKTADERPKSMDEVAAALDPTASLREAAVIVSSQSEGDATTALVQVGQPSPSQDPAAGSPVAAHDSTLSGLASEVSRPPGLHNRGRVGVAAVGVLGLLAIGLYWAVGRAPAPAAPTASVVATPATPAPAPAPATVRLSLDSTPAGAEVYQMPDGILVGQTPCVLELAAARGKRVFVLRLDGHRDHRFAIDSDKDSAHKGELEPLGLQAPAAAAAAKPPRPSRRPAGTGKVGNATVNPFP